MATNDVGIQAVGSLFEQLMIDEAWAVREPRGFTWWAYRLAQHVEASPPTWDGQREVCEVRVWTEVANVVDANRDPATVMGNANQQQTLSALAWDPVGRTVAEYCTVVVHEENIGWLIRVLAMAAVMQNTAAHSRSHGVAAAVGGVPATSSHPSNGERPEMDDILNVPAQVIAPAGEQSSAFLGPLTEGLEAFVGQLGLLGFASEQDFTCEVPFTGSRPVAMVMQTNEPPETSLLRILPDVPHPEYGHGALVILSPPLSFEKEQVADVANQLNLMEATENTDTAQLGAWCPSPVGGAEDGVAFNTFIPSALARPGILENEIIYQSVRSRFAASQLAQ